MEATRKEHRSTKADGDQGEEKWPSAAWGSRGQAGRTKRHLPDRWPVTLLRPTNTMTRDANRPVENVLGRLRSHYKVTVFFTRIIAKILSLGIGLRSFDVRQSLSKDVLTTWKIFQFSHRNMAYMGFTYHYFTDTEKDAVWGPGIPLWIQWHSIQRGWGCRAQGRCDQWRWR